MSQKYKLLSSRSTDIISNDGIDAKISTRSLLTWVAMSNFKSHILGQTAIDNGCTSTNSVAMISNVMYYDTINKTEVENPDSLTGQYDINIIYKTIKGIIRNKAIDIIRKNKIPENETIIQKQIDFFEKNSREKLDSVISEGVLSTALHINIARFDNEIISDIRNDYRNCPSDQYFFIPLLLIPFVPIKLKWSSHANGILISKAKGTVYRIEPQYSSELDAATQKKIDNGIIRFVNEIGLRDPTLKKISVKCPQAVVHDENCIFWTLFIFEEIAKNMYKNKTVDQIVQEISSKPIPQLEDMIYNYKKKLFGTLIPSFLKENKLKWPEYENNKQLFLSEIETDYIANKSVVPKMGVAPRLGGKTRKSKKQRARH